MEIGDKVGEFVYMGKDEERNLREKERVKKGEIKNAPTYHLWRCKCGNITSQTMHNITHNLVKSCGCSHNVKKGNKYEFYDDYVIGHFNTRDEFFYIDLEDYEKVSQYTWFYCDGYALADKRINGKVKKIKMHQLVTNFQYEICDHMDRNTLNNRKSNLRPATHAQNMWNFTRKFPTKSGIIGVSPPQPRGKKWKAYIGVNGESITLGYFLEKEDAIIARLKAEKEYYGDFAPQRHLFEQYNI